MYLSTQTYGYLLAQQFVGFILVWGKCWGKTGNLFSSQNKCQPILTWVVI